MPAHALRPLLLSAATATVIAAAAVAGSVAVVRQAARGGLLEEDDVPATPVGLVLGAQVYPDGTPSRFLIGRLELARRLHAAGTVEQLIVSGDSLAPEWDEPAAMRRYLVAAGVPDEAIISDPAGFDTYDSCVRARDVYGVAQLVVITQRYHLARAVGTARLVGLDAVGVGDRSVRIVYDGGQARWSRAWRRGALRELPACVKTLIDVGTRRRPVLTRTLTRPLRS